MEFGNDTVGMHTETWPCSRCEELWDPCLHAPLCSIDDCISCLDSHEDMEENVAAARVERSA